MAASVGIEIVLVIGALIGLVLLLALRVRLPRSARVVEKKLQQIEAQLQEYRTYDKYLRNKDRTNYATEVGRARASLRFLRAFRILSRNPNQSLIESYYARVDDLERFLGDFIPQYAKREVERHKAFFSNRSFDKEQIEAIVKRDMYNLVIAGAGSGKTRVLTGRLAFLLECGAVSDKILALAYTKSAEQEMRQRLRTEYGISDANVRTFHSLGRELARRSPRFRSKR